MGILRTDKISGLETPTPVTGSVVFDGTGDYLTVAASNDFDFGTNDFTMEFWVSSTKTGRVDPIGWNYVYTNAGWAGMILNISPGSGSMAWYENANSRISGSGSWNDGSWHHIAVTRSGNSVRMFLDGTQIGSTYTTSHSYGAASSGFIIGTMADPNTGSGPTDGYISNLRLLKGTVLYTSEFTPPVHELEVIGDTVLLCCNNPDSARAEGTGKTITVNGDAAASTFSPGLTRDFTSGTEFQGVTVFDTQGYFVPPSGTTEQRGGTRGLLMGGYNPSNTYLDEILFINVDTTGNSQFFGELTVSDRNHVAGGVSDRTRAVNAGGLKHPGAYTADMEFVTIASTGNAVDFGADLTQARAGLGAVSNGTRGIFAGGYNGPSTRYDTIDYITIQSTGVAAQNFGDLTTARQNPGSICSSTRGILSGGRSGSTYYNTIDYITMSTLGDAADFGDLTVTRGLTTLGVTSNSVRGVIFGGYSGSAYLDTIDYVTIASTGNAQDFGDLSGTRGVGTGVASPTRAVMMGGATPTYTNTIEYVQIMSTGDAIDFGDLNTQITAYGSGVSNGHGGLS